MTATDEQLQESHRTGVTRGRNLAERSSIMSGSGQR